MSSILISIVSFVFAIGVLVAVHEYGHFWVARRVGVLVHRYSIGFGRPLWRRRSAHADGTEYWISAIPLGGYVKLLDEREETVPPELKGRAFNNKPLASKVAVLAAGPSFNFLFAIAAFWFMYLVGVPGVRPIVGDIKPDSPAAVAGLHSRDEIVSVDGRRVDTWEGTVLALLDGLLEDGDINLQIERGGAAVPVELAVQGREEELTEPGALLSGLGISPWSPPLPPVVGEVSPDGSAAASGLQPGDRILEAAGQPLADWISWRDFVRARPGQTVNVELERGGRRLQLPLSIGSVEDGGKTVGQIGAAVSVDAARAAAESIRAEQRYGPLTALSRGAGRTLEMSTLTVRMLWRMVTGDVSVRNISGPINIAQYAGATARLGLSSFLNFLAVVSISLGILNLLPIPMLDGGQIVYQVAEAIKGRPLSERTLMISQQLGLLVLLMVMGFAFYNDLTRIFGGG